MFAELHNSLPKANVNALIAKLFIELINIIKNKAIYKHLDTIL
jgi:hypothetical protein